jgi:hypothetical protein
VCESFHDQHTKMLVMKAFTRTSVYALTNHEFGIDFSKDKVSKKKF